MVIEMSPPVAPIASNASQAAPVVAQPPVAQPPVTQPPQASEPTATPTASEPTAIEPATSSTATNSIDAPPGDVTLVGVSSDEFALLDSLYQSYMRFLAASKAQAEAAKELSAAQTAFDACQDETRGAKESFESILKSLPDELIRLRDPAAAAMIDHVQSDADDSPVGHDPAAASTQADEATAARTYEQWKALSTQALIDQKIPGLGKKKALILLDKFPTIGDLEKARADAAARQSHFNKQLPRGFGENVADAIQDAMEKLLMGAGSARPLPDDPQDVAAFAKTRTVPDDPQDVAAIASTRTASDQPPDESPDQPATSLAVDPLSIDPDEELTYEELTTNELAELDDFLDSTDDDIDDSTDDAEDFSTADAPGTLTAMEWIDSIYERLTEDHAEQKRLWGMNAKNSAEWHRGYKAQQGGFEIGDCPYGRDAEAKAQDWIRGWIAASMNMDL